MDKEISILGIPLDMGAGTFGTRLGPDAIRIAGLIEELKNLSYRVHDLGNLVIVNGYKKEKTAHNIKNMDRLIDALEKINRRSYDLFMRDSFPLLLGGDHSMILASFKAFMKKYDNAGLIYIDAHADINTEKTSPSGNAHGMPVAALMNMCHKSLNEIGGNFTLDPQKIVYVGIRDIDKGEEELIEKLNIKYFPISYINEVGVKKVVDEIKKYFIKLDDIYLSFDIDSIDSDIAPGTGVGVRGGLTYNQANYILSLLGQYEKIKGLELVEVSPTLDIKNKTSELARELILAFFGRKFI